MGASPRAKTRPVPRRGIRHHRLGRLAALAVGAFLLSWCAVLGATLPAMGEAVLVELPLSAAAKITRPA
jgi:hypothetical protein